MILLELMPVPVFAGLLLQAQTRLSALYNSPLHGGQRGRHSIQRSWKFTWMRPGAKPRRFLSQHLP